MFDWLDNTVIKLCTMPPVGTDLNTVKDQLNEMKVCTWERVLKEDCFILGFVCVVWGRLVLSFGCAQSWLLCAVFLQLRRVGAGYSVVAVRSFSLWLLVAERRLQLLAVHRLTCPVACGIFSHQGSNTCPLHWQADPATREVPF